MIETYQIQSKFARQIETALIESFYEAFGKNVKDCLGEITRGVFTLPQKRTFSSKKSILTKAFASCA